MIDLPKELALLRPLLVAFSAKTQERFLVLTLGAIVAMGRRTVSRVLWAVCPLALGPACGYHRFFSSARWSLWILARVLAAMVMELTDPQAPVFLIVDDTVVGHRGQKVFGKGWHRDAVNSSRSHLVKKLGHKWVVMAVNVTLPRCKGPWALPVLAALYIVPPKLPDAADGQRLRDVQMLGGSGGWYRCRGSGRGALVPVRWVYLREMLHQGEAYLYSTDPALADEAIATGFVLRWPIEVTFEEVRAHLGFHTPRQRCQQSVLRTGPCLLGLFSLVSLIYAQIAAEKPVKLQTTCCYVKSDPTFADALAAVRRVIWEKIILPRTAGGTLAAQFPPPLKELLLDHLTAAA